MKEPGYISEVFQVRNAKLTTGLVGVSLEALHDRLLPAHVRSLGQVLPLGVSRVTHEGTMLGTEPKLLDVTKVLAQELLVSTTDDPDGVLVVSTKRADCAKQAVAWEGGGWVLDNWSQSAVVIEHEQSLARIAVFVQHDGLVQKWSSCGVVIGSEDREQAPDVACGPCLHIMGSNVVVQALVQSGFLVLGHRERVVDHVRYTSGIPWVDVKGVSQAASGSREL